MNDPSALGQLTEAIAAARAKPLRADPLEACADVAARIFDADVLLVVSEEPSGFDVLSVEKGDATLGNARLAAAPPIASSMTPAAVVRIAAPGCREAVHVPIPAGQAHRVGVVIGWAAGRPATADDRLLRVFALMADTLFAERCAERRLRLHEPTPGWSNSILSDPPDVEHRFAADVLAMLLDVVPYASGCVLREGDAGVVPVASHPPGAGVPVAIEGLAALAIDTRRPQYVDTAGDLMAETAIAAPFRVLDDKGVVVVRGDRRRKRVLPYEIDVVAAAAQVLAGERLRANVVTSGRQVEAAVAWLAGIEAQGRIFADSASLLEAVAPLLAERMGADLAWMSMRDSLVLCDVRGAVGVHEMTLSGPGLAGELERGVVVQVDRISALRAAEERPLQAAGMHSYIAVGVESGVLGFASATPARFVSVPDESLRRVGAIVGGVLGRGAATAAASAASYRLNQVTALNQRLLTSIGHQFRTPLTSIAGFARTLLAPDANVNLSESDRSEFLAILARQAARLTRLIDNFLLVADLEMETYRPVRTIVDLADVVQAAVRDLAPAGDQSTPVRLNVPRLEVALDPAALRSIVTNLVDNAVRFGRDDVRVEATREGGVVILTCSDRGPGISSDDRERVVRLWSAETEDVNPTVGMGLYLVSRLSAALGGELALDETPGGGLMATVRLPVA